MEELSDSANNGERHGYGAVIIAYKQPDLVTQVLEDLAGQTMQPSAVTVVDNGGDTAFEWSDDSAISPNVIRLPSNPGYAAAVNAIRKQSLGEEFTLVLTHDVRLDEGTVAEMLKVARAEPFPEVVAPILYYASQPDVLYSRGGILNWAGVPRHADGPPNAEVSSAVDWADGAVLLLRNAALDRLGWLDEDYFLYFEEVDYCARVRLEGGEVRVANQSRAYQEPGNFTLYLQVRNQVLFIRKRGRPLVLALMVGAAISLKAIGKSILSGEWSNVHLAIQGFRDGLRGTRTV